MKKSLAGLTLVSGLLAPFAARADVAVSVGGHVAIGGAVGVTVGPPRPRPRPPGDAVVVVGGGFYADGYAYAEFAEPPPPPPPPVDPCCCCEPAPPPQVYYGPPPSPAPAAAAVVVAQPRPRRLGLGARLSGLRIGGDDGPNAEGIGGLLRLRGRRAELELELGQDHFHHSERVDTRVGGSIYLYLMQTRLRPYLLVGAGLNMIDNYYGAPDAKQGYLEGGAGLMLRLGPAFALSGDLRWSSRRVVGDGEETMDYHTALPVVPEKERGFEGRIAGVIYF